jgi:hypothetical protein
MRNWKTLAIVAVLLAGGLLLGATWNAGYEGSPAGTDLASDLDTFIQSFKADVRKRLGVEHIFGTGTDDNGLHTMGSARGFAQNAAPTNISGSGAYNNAADSFDALPLSTDEIGATTRDIGAGRLWADLDGVDTGTSSTPDDNQLKVWNETTNLFVEVKARDVGGAGIGASNLVYNGNFEVTDGTGLVASTTAPAGWSNLSTSTIAYTDPTAVSEGEGLALKTTAAGGADEGVRKALANLKASTAYVFRVRVRATAGDTCNLNVADGTTTVNDVSLTTGAFETLEAVLTTTAVPATVNMDLRSTLDTDVCEWAHATVFEQYATVPTPGVVACWDTDTTATSDAYTTVATWVDGLVSCEVTVPGPGYIIQVDGTLVADNDVGNSTEVLAVRLREEGVTVDLKTGFAAADSDNANRFEDIVSVPVKYVNVNPTPGTTYTYTLEASPGAGSGGNPSWDRNLGDDGVDDLNDGALLATNLRVLLIPVR